MPILFLLVPLLLSSCCFHGDGLQVQSNEEFECVNIYKQPAFDNVLLKNHKIQMSPSFIPKLKKQKKNSKEESFLKYSNFESDQTKACPPGMVPITTHRSTLNETELRSLAKLHLGINNKFQTLTTDKPGRHFAAMHIDNPDTLGGRAKISLHNPPVQMNQISMSQLWIESGEPSQLNSIQVGWAVHPRIYGDNLTRATAYWTADGSQKTGCYNTMCPGFVQVHPSFKLGQIYKDVSVPDGPQFVTEPYVFADIHTGNWWLVVDDNIKVGYWPKELFTHLTQGGIEFIQFGGWTFNSPDGVSPPMGSGTFPDNHYKRSSYFAQIRILDDNVLINAPNLKAFVDNASCYDLKYWEDQGGDLQETFTYGGPGGICGI